MITNEQLAEIKDYCAKATPGPWEAPQQRLMEEQTIYGAWKKEDAEFITNARTDLPLLVAEVERLKNELQWQFDRDWTASVIDRLNELAREQPKFFSEISTGPQASKMIQEVHGLFNRHYFDLSAAQRRIEELFSALEACCAVLHEFKSVQRSLDFPSLVPIEKERFDRIDDALEKAGKCSQEDYKPL